MITVGIVAVLASTLYTIWTREPRGACPAVGLTGARCVLTYKHDGSHIYGRK